jgi:hypothetical protein
MRKMNVKKRKRTHRKSELAKEGRGHRREEPSDFATLRWFPSPKDLHVLPPKQFPNASLLAKCILNLSRFIKL